MSASFLLHTLHMTSFFDWVAKSEILISLIDILCRMKSKSTKGRLGVGWRVILTTQDVVLRDN